MSSRYFPVNQDFHADPEMWELRDKFGDRAALVWFEILSIAERNRGWLPGPWSEYPSILKGRCKSTLRQVTGVCQWVDRWLIVNSQGIARVRNYPKYHKVSAEGWLSPNLTYPNLTKERTSPTPPTPSAASSNDEKKPQEEKKMRTGNLPEGIKVFTDQLWGISQEKYRKGNLTALVHHFRKNYGDEVIALTYKRLVEQAENADDWRAWLSYMIDHVDPGEEDFQEHLRWWQKTKAEEMEFGKGKFRSEFEQQIVGFVRPLVKDVPRFDEQARRRELQAQKVKLLRGDK